MRKNKIIYWTTTGLVATFMTLGAFNFFFNPQTTEALKLLGFPYFFKIELAVMKLIGALALILPQVPFKVKQWAYAGFGIVFISASFSHLMMGDKIAEVIIPTVLLVALALSNFYFDKWRDYDMLAKQIKKATH
jgi:DoxX-like family